MADTQDELSVEQALALARGRGVERRDAQVLLGHLLQRSRSWLLAHGEWALSVPQWQGFEAQCEERARGVPVAYLTGQREFYGMLLQITPDVLDPRADTEVLVDWALSCLSTKLAHVAAPQVLDLGTGSGAIALAIKKAHPQAQLLAIDDSGEALRVAECNARQQDLTLSLAQSHWFDALGQRQFDLIVSNPPYIAATDPHLPALHAEPRAALVAGADGLDDLRIIVREAPRHLSSGGALLLEHGSEQAQAVAQLLLQAGFSDIAHRHDLAGHVRCTGGFLAPAATAAI